MTNVGPQLIVPGHEKHRINYCFVISFLYNVVGIYYAVQGTLSPLIAAILMPLSSISVVAFATFAINYMASRKLK